MYKVRRDELTFRTSHVPSITLFLMNESLATMNAQNQTFRSSLLEPSSGDISLLTDEDIMPFIEHSISPQSDYVPIEEDDQPVTNTPNESCQSRVRATQVSDDEESLDGRTSQNFLSKESESEGSHGCKALIMSWVLELSFLIVGLLCFTAMVSILFSMQGQRRPHWPYKLNLSTIVAILATVLRSMLMQVVEQGMHSLTVLSSSQTDQYVTSALSASQ